MPDKQEWFEEVWRVREEEIYPELFGAHSGGILTLDMEIFEPFQVGKVDPRWLTHGVIPYPPNDKRATWMYVTSGLSNEWFEEQPNPNGWSGVGCELVMETREYAPWAGTALRRLLAFQILLGWGHYENRDPLAVGDLVPWREPLDGAQSKLTYCLIAPPEGYPPTFRLASGSAAFLHIIGITEAEAAVVRESGYEALLERLNGRGYPLTEPGRESVVTS